jgi:uncharacterized protein HemX
MSNIERINKDFQKIAEIVQSARQRRKETKESYSHALQQVVDSDPQSQELHKQCQEEMTKMIQSRHKIINMENELAALKKQYKDEFKCYKQLKLKRDHRLAELEVSPELAALKESCNEAKEALAMLKTAVRSGREKSE